MIPALGITLLMTTGLVLWARWLGRLYGVPRFVRHLAWFFAAVWALGAAWSVMGMLEGFGAISSESVDPSQKARILAEGIAESMNALAISAALLLFGAVVMLVLTWRYHWTAKPPNVPRDPPYR